MESDFVFPFCIILFMLFVSLINLMFHAADFYFEAAAGAIGLGSSPVNMIPFSQQAIYISSMLPN